MIKFLNIFLQFLFIRVAPIDKGLGFGIIGFIYPLTGWFSSMKAIGKPKVIVVRFNKTFPGIAQLIQGAQSLRKSWIRKLQKMAAKMKYKSLTTAIEDADKQKSETGKKMMVVFNRDTKEYEAIAKQDLKKVANRRTRSSKGKAKTARLLDHNKIHRIEKRSLYVAK